MTTERRTQRSDHIYEAVTYQIEAVCKDYGVQHLALASDDGLVIACSGDAPKTEWLAAIAPRLATPSVPVKSLANEGAVAVLDLVVQGNKVYLVGTSGSRAATQRGLEHARRGIRRIFQTRVPMRGTGKTARPPRV